MNKVSIAVGRSISLFVFSLLLATSYAHAETMFFPVEMRSGESIRGRGDLHLPNGAQGKVPLVILAHGTRGVGYRESSWSDFLLEQGYATFMLDYFSPRGADGRGRDVPRPPEDVWGAIKALAANPQIDATRIAVMGFSNGGSVTRSSAELDPARDTGGIAPKAYVMVYGGCHTAISFHSSDYKPALLYIAGGKDQLVKANTCEARKSDSRAPDTEVLVIEGAYHMCDSNDTKTINHPKWGTVEMRADQGATEIARKKVVELFGRVFK